MLVPLLSLTLSVADPLGFPLAAAPLATATASTATATPSATAPSTSTATAPAPFTLPASAPSLSGLALPAVALALLAVVTLILARRRRVESRFIRVLETTSLGPKRALVVARLGDEVMVIGSSEAGLQLLAARRAGEVAPAAIQSAEAVPLRAVPDAFPEAAPARHGPLAAMLGRLGLGGAARGEAASAAAPLDVPAFDALLAESAEDQELRRKLARGQAGSVR